MNNVAALSRASNQESHNLQFLENFRLQTTALSTAKVHLVRIRSNNLEFLDSLDSEFFGFNKNDRKDFQKLKVGGDDSYDLMLFKMKSFDCLVDLPS